MHARWTASPPLMLDIGLVRRDPERVIAGLDRRGIEDGRATIAAVAERDRTRREALKRVNDLKALRNKTSKEIGAVRRQGGDASGQIAAMREVGDEIAGLDAVVAEADSWLAETLATIPNLPEEPVPAGGVEANRIVRQWGSPPDHSFAPRPHWELGESLGILDLAAAAKVSGSGFTVLRGRGAALQRGLINWMIGLHAAEHGYEEVRVPYLVTASTMTGTGQLPRFAEESYVTEPDALWLIPTAEVPVTNLHREEILSGDALPLKYVAYSPCFRREAGAAGRDTRGMLRVHQFDKVELVRFERPEARAGAPGGMTPQAGRPGGIDRRGGPHPGAARAALPGGPAGRRGSRLLLGAHLRPRGLGAGRREVARGFELFQLSRLSGAAGPDPVPAESGCVGRIRAHAQRFGAGAAETHGGPAGNVSAGRRLGAPPGGARSGGRLHAHHGPGLTAREGSPPHTEEGR